MRIPKYLSLENNLAVYRPVGECSFDQAVDMVDGAIAYCKANNIRGLLVDVTGLTGFPSPSTAQRFQFATKWSGTADGSIFLAVVAPPELIDPDQIGVTMLSNRGLQSKVSTNDADALEWLRSVCKSS